MATMTNLSSLQREVGLGFGSYESSMANLTSANRTRAYWLQSADSDSACNDDTSNTVKI
jgi:hypothetical protein